jgi:hypothetical protein
LKTDCRCGRRACGAHSRQSLSAAPSARELQARGQSNRRAHDMSRNAVTCSMGTSYVKVKELHVMRSRGDKCTHMKHTRLSLFKASCVRTSLCPREADRLHHAVDSSSTMRLCRNAYAAGGPCSVSIDHMQPHERENWLACSHRTANTRMGRTAVSLCVHGRIGCMFGSISVRAHHKVGHFTTSFSSILEPRGCKIMQADRGGRALPSCRCATGGVHGCRSAKQSLHLRCTSEAANVIWKKKKCWGLGRGC